MASTIYSVVTVTESNDPDRTIEEQAEALKQDIITKYYELNPDERSGTEHDRIVLTAGAVIDDN